jgi:DNA repair photolyase
LNKSVKGRGSSVNPGNKFSLHSLTFDHKEGIDEQYESDPKTSFFIETPGKIISKNKSPDVPYEFSINPYQGCEHGCVYCYARNSHEYWGFSSGLDFESKIIVKPAAPELLRKAFYSSSWKPALITLSGNTDCYQPVEKKLEITRNLLKVFAEFRNPVSIITKNVLIWRDADILADLAGDNLTHVLFSITTLKEDLRLLLEPRTAIASKKLKIIEKLSKSNIPVGVMIGPVIPGINDQEIPEITRVAAENGARMVSYSMVRLNGSIGRIFEDWLKRYFPERFNKIWGQVSSLHDGRVNDSEWGRRMSGEGPIADTIKFIFESSKNKYFKNSNWPQLDFTKFRYKGIYNLFG